ncbi:MAG TPA: thioredoxin family protein [Candidatus Dormibacteraeota bacterium]|nr:thioredoxin family protein [Candidatus Dormibacteraeota bacterium]
MILTLVAPLVALAIVGAAALLLRVQRARQLDLVGHRVEPAPALDGEAEPTLLYFTGEACTICHTAQTPALRRLAGMLSRPVVVREIDVAVQPALARSYRVMSLPTTVVLDPRGRVSAVNVGFAPAERLRKQRDGARQAVAA